MFDVTLEAPEPNDQKMHVTPETIQKRYGSECAA